MVTRKGNVDRDIGEDISFEPDDGASAGLLNASSLKCSKD